MVLRLTLVRRGGQSHPLGQINSTDSGSKPGPGRVRLIFTRTPIASRTARRAVTLATSQALAAIGPAIATSASIAIGFRWRRAARSARSISGLSRGRDPLQLAAFYVAGSVLIGGNVEPSPQYRSGIGCDLGFLILALQPAQRIRLGQPVSDNGAHQVIDGGLGAPCAASPITRIDHAATVLGGDAQIATAYPAFADSPGEQMLSRGWAILLPARVIDQGHHPLPALARY